MAFTQHKSRKCPVCVGCTQAKIDEVNTALNPILEEVKSTGEVPKAADKRFVAHAHALGISPYSLQYHLRTCLVDLEIQDQRLLELKDFASLLATAKHEFETNPTMQNATSVKQMADVFRALCEDIEGQQDPNETVTYLTEAVLSPIARQTLATTTENLRNLRDALLEFVPKTQSSFIRSQIDSALQNMASSMRATMDESLKNICNYYKFELDAQHRKRAMEATISNEVKEPAQVTAINPMKKVKG
jgi:hypothetical protein